MAGVQVAGLCWKETLDGIADCEVPKARGRRGPVVATWQCMRWIGASMAGDRHCAIECAPAACELIPRALNCQVVQQEQAVTKRTRPGLDRQQRHDSQKPCVRLIIIFLPMSRHNSELSLVCSAGRSSGGGPGPKPGILPQLLQQQPLGAGGGQASCRGCQAVSCSRGQRTHRAAQTPWRSAFVCQLSTRHSTIKNGAPQQRL